MGTHLAAWLAAATLAFPALGIAQGNAELMAERRAAAFTLNAQLLERLLTPTADRTVVLRLAIPGAQHLRTPLADRPLSARQLKGLDRAHTDRFDAARDRTASAAKARPYILFDFPADTPPPARGW